MEIKQLDDWFLLDWKFAYNCSQNYDEYINLKTTRWEDMIYELPKQKIIEYPWEYDIQGFSVEVLETWWKLHYIIHNDEEKFAIICDKSALDSDKINETIQTWIVTDHSLQEEIEKYELDWEVVVL